MWWVYVIQSQQERTAKSGKTLPGFFYVGSTTSPSRRLKQHNGVLKKGGKYTSQHRPWVPRALYGPFANRSEAFKAEMALKRTRRGEARAQWKTEDHPLCRGEGPLHPWVKNPDWTP